MVSKAAGIHMNVDVSRRLQFSHIILKAVHFLKKEYCIDFYSPKLDANYLYLSPKCAV